MKNFIFTIIAVLAVMVTSCVHEEIITENMNIVQPDKEGPEGEPADTTQTDVPVEPPVQTVVLKDTLTIDITHDVLMVPVPLLNGRHATVVNSVTGHGRTCVTTVGTESFLLDDLLTIDTIRVTVIDGE